MRKRMRSLKEKKRSKRAVQRHVKKEKETMSEDTKVPAEVPAEDYVREKETITKDDVGEMPAGVVDDTDAIHDPSAKKEGE